MDLFGTHQISLDAIRRLAVECHALDVSAVQLLIDTTINKPELARRTYEELFSEKLLSLAVALRTKFYQGAPSKGSEPFVGHSAFLLVSAREEIRVFTIKDVCDKVIHAESITRPLNDGTAQPITQVRGTHLGVPWVLHISTGLFCEGVLNWIESIDSGGMSASAA
ncbi:MAG TPA: hypothetical protein VGE70_04690 [Burkholderiaceae bacterium]